MPHILLLHYLFLLFYDQKLHFSSISGDEHTITFRFDDFQLSFVLSLSDRE
jgi:hypothetical protein